MAVKLQPFEIPDSLGEAARRYLFAVRENPDNEEPELILLKPFSQCAVRDLNHRPSVGCLFSLCVEFSSLGEKMAMRIVSRSGRSTCRSSG